MLLFFHYIEKDSLLANGLFVLLEGISSPLARSSANLTKVELFWINCTYYVKKAYWIFIYPLPVFLVTRGRGKWSFNQTFLLFGAGFFSDFR